MTIAIINAMHKEHEQIVGLLADVNEVHDGRFAFVEGKLNGQKLVLMESGIGKVNAAVGAVELIKRYQYKEGLYQFYIKNNFEIKKSIEVLSDKPQYNKILKI